MKHDDRKRAVICPVHPEIQATGRFIVVFGRNVRKRFTNFREAERFLDGLRYEVDRGTFDSRDYLSSNPLSYTVLSDKYLEKKKGKITDSYHTRLSGQIRKTQQYFGHTNIKNIQYAQLEDYIDSLSLSDKSKHNLISILHAFWNWIISRREIERQYLPEFPTISYQSKLRRTVSKDTQQQILDEVKRISEKVNPRIYLGIKWLTTYVSVRPAEMLNLKEGHIDLEQGYLFFPHPKEKRPKIVPLIKEDIRIIKSMPRGLPDLNFFRHSAGVSGVKPGQKFGAKSFYKWWKRACDNLDIVDVDLYGGSRHSSVVALREHATPEQIKRATMHTTSKAFDRYFQLSREELEEMYEKTNGKTLGKRKKPLKHGSSG
jgi:integrase